MLLFPVHEAALSTQAWVCRGFPSAKAWMCPCLSILPAGAVRNLRCGNRLILPLCVMGSSYGWKQAPTWSVNAPIFLLYKAIPYCFLYIRSRDESIGKVSMYTILFKDLESGRSGNRCASSVLEPCCLIRLQYSALGHFEKAKGLTSFMARAAPISPLDQCILLP